MAYASYVPFEKAITSEYIVTFGCLVDNILDDRCENWHIDWDRKSPDVIVSIETKIFDKDDGCKYFNMLCPKQLFNIEKFLANKKLMAKEWNG